MTKFRWTEKQKKQIEEHFCYWLTEFGSLPLVIDYQYQTEDCDTPHGGDSAFNVLSTFPYRGLEIRVFPCALKMDKEKLTHAVIHECLHVVLSRLQWARNKGKSVWITAEEEAVDTIALMILNQLPERYMKQ